MVNRNLIRSLEDDDILNELATLAPEDEAEQWLLEYFETEQQDYAQGRIVDGRIVEINDEWVLIEQEVTIDWPGSTRSAAYIDFRAENTDDFDLDAVSLTPVTTQVGWILDPTSLRAETPP